MNLTRLVIMIILAVIGLFLLITGFSMGIVPYIFIGVIALGLSVIVYYTDPDLIWENEFKYYAGKKKSMKNKKKKKIDMKEFQN